MFLFTIVVAGLAFTAWSLFSNTKRRPSPLAALWRFPIIVVLLGAPLVFEDASCSGCVKGPGRPNGQGMPGKVVVLNENGDLENAGTLAWCPNWCVNVPNIFFAKLELSNGLTYFVRFKAHPDAVALVSSIRSQLPDKGVIKSSAVNNEIRKLTDSLLKTYIKENEIDLLRRNRTSKAELQRTYEELALLARKLNLPIEPTVVW